MKIFTFLIVFFLLSNLALFAQPTYNSENQTFHFENIPDPPSFLRSKSARYGISYLEFGDGHYHLQDLPDKSTELIPPVKYVYQENASKEVRAIFTPFYSSGNPYDTIVNVNVISADSKRAEPIYFEQKEWEKRKVHLVTNKRGEIVSGHRIRGIAHYRAPVNLPTPTHGYVLIFFNSRKEINPGFDPFTYLSWEERKFKGEVPSNFIPPDISPEARSNVRSLQEEYKKVRAFKVSGMTADEERRIFFTLKSDSRLEDFQNKKQKLSITVLWDMAGVPFDRNQHMHRYSLEILEVHDPNRIVVEPTTEYYRRNNFKLLSYRVDFQNTAGGIVKDVEVVVPIDPGLDTASLDITNIDPSCEPCRSRIPTERDSSGCYVREWVSTVYGTSLRLTIRNIGLAGKENSSLFNKRLTKGSFEFEALTNNAKRDRITASAAITFKGAGTMYTEEVHTKWFHKSLNAQAGLIFGVKASGGYRSVAEQFDDRFTASLSYLHSPIGKGFLYGAELGVAAFKLKQEYMEPISLTPYRLQGGDGFYLQSEVLTVKFLEIRGLTGYQFNRWSKLNAGLGVSIPMDGNTYFEGQIFDSLNVHDPIIYRTEESDLGFLRTVNNSYMPFEEMFDIGNFVGVVGHLGFEAGEQNLAVLGARAEWRYYPDTYSNQYLQILSGAVYIRVKLYAIGGRSRRIFPGSLTFF